MSRSFTATTEYIAAGTAAIPTTGSLLFWCYPTWAQTDGVTHNWFIVTNGTQFFQATKFSDSNLYFGWYNSAEYRVIVSSYTLNANAWNSLVLTWSGSGSELFLNGSSVGTASAPTTWSTSGVTRSVGGNSGIQDCRGRLAEVAVATRVLTAGEVAAFNGGVPVTRFGATLDQYLPLHGVGSPEPDYSGGGNSGTLTGTAAAAHPPIGPAFGFRGDWAGAFTASAPAARANFLTLLGVS